MHHYILNHREMYGLPRKFNIAFDGGGLVSSLDDTNDIGFRAVRVPEASGDETRRISSLCSGRPGTPKSLPEKTTRLHLLFPHPNVRYIRNHLLRHIV